MERDDFADAARSGVFFVGGADLHALQADARECGLATYRIDLRGCTGKADLMRRLADALAFPASFGHNWDALADSLGDLSWRPAPGHVLLFDHAADLHDADAAAFDTLLDILDQASSTWATQHTPFFAFLALAGDRGS